MNEMEDKVSVVIPVYNVEKYLDRCMESVVQQSYKNLEIILINDGSSDDCEVKCRKWELLDERITYISKKNEGLGPTRNLGIRKASGEYLIFIDSDDWWEKDTVEKLYTSAKKYNADIVYMNFYFTYYNENGKLVDDIFIRHHLFEGVTTVEETPELIFDLDARMWSKLFRRKLFVENEIYMPAHPFEDFPIMPLLVLSAQRLCQVHDQLYHYFYKRNDNLIGNVANYKYINDGVNELFNEFVKRGYEEKYRSGLKRYIYDMCRFAINDLPARTLSLSEYEKFKIPFINTIEKICPEEKFNLGVKVILWGSYSNRLITYNLVFSQKQIINHYMFSSLLGLNGSENMYVFEKNENAPKNPFRVEMIQKELQHSVYHNIDELKNADYIIIDFLEEVNDVIKLGSSYITFSEAFQEQMLFELQNYEKIHFLSEKRNVLWKTSCSNFISFLKTNKLEDKIVLMKLYLAETYGTSKEKVTMYENVEEIRKKNKLLKEYYEFFEQNIDSSKAMFIDFLEYNNYTYQYTKYGCLPQYYNGKFNTLASQKLENTMIRRDI